MTIQAILEKDVIQYRTSARSRASFKTVFTGTSNFHRIEEGVHDEEEASKQEWRKGSGQAVMNRLFKPDSKIYAAWELLKELPAHHDGPELQSSEVMTVTGNSTAILTPCDYGGATVTRTEQVVKCHQDDVENFTFVIYGCKTFLVAPPEAVQQGKTYASENHRADTGSSAFRKAVITPGQLLYLPRLWWHEVHTNPDGCMTIGRWVCGELQLSPGAAEPA
jgi:hypothetical protein